MPTAIFQTRPTDWLKSEEDDAQFSREQVIVAAGQNLASGAVIGKVAATGKVVLHTAAATDGSQAVYGILFDNVDATAGDKNGVAIVRDAVVAADKLTYEAGADAAAKAAVVAALKALNGPILSRQSA
jgi:hypothetical protein